MHLIRHDPRNMPVWDVEDILSYFDVLKTVVPADQ